MTPISLTKECEIIGDTTPLVSLHRSLVISVHRSQTSSKRLWLSFIPSESKSFSTLFIIIPRTNERSKLVTADDGLFARGFHAWSEGRGLYAGVRNSRR